MTTNTPALHYILLTASFLALLLLAATGCDEETSGGGGSDGDSDSDSDSDSDTDGDADSDSDADLPAICDDFEIDVERILEEVTYLSTDAMGGRLPGSPGNEAAMVLVEEAFEELGLEPAGDDGTYRQSFTFATGGDPYDVSSIDSANILGVLEGDHEELAVELVIVGAHLDHIGDDGAGGIYNGADDNASGVAVMMEIARALVCDGVAPARTVLFAGWNAEDSGIGSGASHFIQHPYQPLDDIAAVLILDMVGAGDATGVVVYNGVGANSWIADAISGSAGDDGLEYTIDPRVTGSAWSDQVPFHNAGVPAVLLLTLPGLEGHPGYHTIADDITNVNAEDMLVAARITRSALDTFSMGNEDDYL